MNDIIVKGKLIDGNYRCVHYHSLLDIIAIKFKCCNVYYPCYYCHHQEADHQAEVWKKNETETKAILCGICKHELTIQQYFTSNNQCPSCRSKFNPNCSKHHDFYFEGDIDLQD